MSIKVYRMSEPRKRVNMMRMADLTTAFPVGHVLLKRGNRHLNIWYELYMHKWAGERGLKLIKFAKGQTLHLCHNNPSGNLTWHSTGQSWKIIIASSQAFSHLQTRPSVLESGSFGDGILCNIVWCFIIYLWRKKNTPHPCPPCMDFSCGQTNGLTKAKGPKNSWYVIKYQEWKT